MAEQDVSAHSVQLTQEFAHRQLMSPLAIQLLSTLSLSQAEVDAVVAARIAANPLLVAGPPRRCRWCASVLQVGRCPRCAGPVALAWEPVAVVDEREELTLQARLLVRPALASVVDLVVSHLDERGLLPAPAASAPVREGPPPTGPKPYGPSNRWTTRGGSPGRPRLPAGPGRWHASRGGPDSLVPVVADTWARSRGGIMRRSPRGSKPTRRRGRRRGVPPRPAAAVRADGRDGPPPRGSAAGCHRALPGRRPGRDGARGRPTSASAWTPSSPRSRSRASPGHGSPSVVPTRAHCWTSSTGARPRFGAWPPRWCTRNGSTCCTVPPRTGL